VEAYKKYRDQGVVFVSLTPDSKERLADVNKFVEKYGIEWPTGYDAKKTLIQFKAEYFPAIWLIDRQGKVVWNRDEEGPLEDAIAKIISSPQE